MESNEYFVSAEIRTPKKGSRDSMDRKSAQKEGDLPLQSADTFEIYYPQNSAKVPKNRDMIRKLNPKNLPKSHQKTVLR